MNATEQQEALAKAFADQLQSELSPDDWQGMRAANGKGDYVAACASHDYCDSNMVMADAFALTIGRPFLPEDEPPSNVDCDLWNEAWAIAKRDYLTA
jgi:hypothetical protein